MSTQSAFLALRAIGSEFARRLWWSSFVVALIVSLILVAILVWLASMSGWWWLLALPIGTGISVAAVLFIVFRLLIRHVRPAQTTEQRTLVQICVAKLRFVSEITHTPKYILLFRTIRSIAAPRTDTYLQTIFDTKQLKKDFLAVSRSFENNYPDASLRRDN